MLRVLVTGGAGFIGSHLVDRLLSEGYSVVVIDNLSSSVVDPCSFWGCSGTLKFIKCDLVSPSIECVSAFRDVSFVFHFAANPEVRVSYTDPMIHFENNMVATMNVLEASRKSMVEGIVFASSSTVYGVAERIPTPEDHPLEPISVYGAMKASGEITIKTYSRLYKLKSLILRYANIVGPRLRHGVIWDFINKLTNNPSVLEILGDGLQRKSYLYIDDAVEATLRAYNLLLSDEPGSIRVYNIGNTDWVYVKDIARIVADVMGLSSVEFKYITAIPGGVGWPGDVKYMLLDISRIVNDTGWRPRYNSYECIEKTAKAIYKGATQSS
ncbi:MAG: NAD-dependent epimerase/dehydratase family protein [Desulfurococcales archaeon]|nr:NAD-dependent epimerase/dehydratase family protein [Desulfurococcales archaeon]